MSRLTVSIVTEMDMVPVIVPETQNELNVVLRQEVVEWFDRFSCAWDARDLETLTSMVDPSLTGRMVMMDGETIWDATYKGDIDGTRDFFAFVASHYVVTDHQLYAVVFRSSVEAIMMTRKTMQILDGHNPRTVTQFALETLRRDEGDEWRLVRYWAEKAQRGA